MGLVTSIRAKTWVCASWFEVLDMEEILCGC